MSDPQSPTHGRWSFWIDRGGTFTDIVARQPNGRLLTHKLLSENPEQYTDAATAGMRALLNAHGETLESAPIEMVRMGTTVATNALLERKGAPTVLAITRGFGDALRIGYQSRPRLFDRHIRLPEALYAHVVEIDERIGADGSVVRALDETTARQDLQQAFDAGLRAVAIVLMHGYRYTAHELRLAAMARDIGYTQISVSHEVGALIRLVGRGDTTVADAYLSPVLRHYVDAVARELGDVRLLFMQSNGGLANAHAFRGKDAILSGPAGGIVGMARTAAAAGLPRVIGFDMGGTSTDVSHYAGEYERTHEQQIAGVRLRTPMMDIHTVAAGGGSICRFDGTRLRVGPESAGAVPGPACYRRGGPLTVTDCNVLLGRLQPAFFPAVFGADGRQPIDREIVIARFDALADEVAAASGQRLTREALAQGFLRIAVEHMANAIKEISIQRGRDVRRYALSAFGGAAGQHACAVADALGMERVMIHPFAGVLSAYGMGLADLREIRERSVGLPLSEAKTLDAIAETLAADARDALRTQHWADADIHIEMRAHLKYAGSDTPLPVAYAEATAMRVEFEAQHRSRFGFVSTDKPVLIELLSAEAVGRLPASEISTAATQAAPTAAIAQTQVPACFGADTLRVPLFDRETLASGATIDGPAIIRERTGTTIIEPGWRACVETLGHLLLERVTPFRAPAAAGTTADPILLEVFNKLFMAVAEQMGYALQNTAHSVNIKERLDFSCALFDPQGRLIANAPHIPVHLGSMGDSVRAIIAGRSHDGREFCAGQAWMLNAPYNGGTHLPDVTVVMPVIDKTTLLGFVAARGHHADIGGITPGSMPPHSRSVEQEGVLIDDFLLMEHGCLREAETRALFLSGTYPARNIDQNIADLQAQIAACVRGADELVSLVRHYGHETVTAYMAHVLANAEAAVRQMIDRLHDGSAVCRMDSGAEIRVRISIDRDRRQACIDFSGSSPQRPDNFNAPLSVCRAAVLYVVRCLIDDDIPLNDGCLRPVDLVVPEGSMLNPKHPAAVVAGNVETSQIIVDALFAAFGALAGSQGTMNNFTFGSAQHQYYETICGGSGAGPGFDGASAVQTHMTNSRLTDPEVLESRFPVRVDAFTLRSGSGGNGQFHGGDGVVRRIRFLEPMTAAMLANRRDTAPSGLNGGGDGARGAHYVERMDGRIERLPATAEVSMQVGDVFVVETPGGGGYGSVP